MRWSLLEIMRQTEIAVWQGEEAFLLRDLGTEYGAKDVLEPSPALRDRLSNPTWHQGLRAVDLHAARFLPPLLGQKILCAGLNYRDHILETHSETTSYPNFFTRFPDSFVGHEEALEIPPISSALDYEVELAVILGRPLFGSISRDAALAAVGGYTICNDGSFRDLQFRASQWTLGKNVPRSGALGPWVLSADELPLGAQGLQLQTWVGTECLQDGNSADLLFDVADLLIALAAVLPLAPGDVLATGTSAGVGFTREPPRFLRDGEVCELRIEGIGSLRNPVRKAAHSK
ncbi:MAG: fumarylacetoacetate hydrolase family protein [Candidatus Igneacidithiobacillus chanchocoensis]